MKKLTWPVWLNRNLLGFGIASFMGDANHEIVPLILPLLIVQLVSKQAAPELVALISGSATALASISGLFAGKLSDHLQNRKPLITLGYFLTGSLVGLLAFAQHWVVVFILMLGAWIGRGLVSAPRNAIIADTTDKKYYGRAFGFRQALDTLGSVLGPLIVYVLAGWPLKYLFLVALVPGVLAFMVVQLFVEDVPHRTTQELDWRFIKKMPKAFYALLGVFLLFGLGGFNKTLIVLRMKELLSPGDNSVGALSIITLLYVFRNVIQTIASYVVGALSDKIGRIIPLVVFGFGFFGLTALLLASTSTSTVHALITFLLSGISAGSYMTLQKALAADLLPEQVRGTGYGILKTVDSVANLASSIIIGLLWSNYSAQVAFGTAAVISMVNIILLLGLRKKLEVTAPPSSE